MTSSPDRDGVSILTGCSAVAVLRGSSGNGTRSGALRAFLSLVSDPPGPGHPPNTPEAATAADHNEGGDHRRKENK